jgi:adenine-specific DNA-methyltransferase
MTKVIESVYVQSPLALGVGVYAIRDFGRFNPYFLMGVLNSKYLTYYINIKFKDKHLAGGYLAINKTTLEKLPLVKPTTSIESSIIELSKRIIEQKEKNPLVNTVELEKKIDILVYRLYDLTVDEIRLVEEKHSINN